MPHDPEFSAMVSTVFNVLNIGPEQGKMLLALMALAYGRGKVDSAEEIQAMLTEMKDKQCLTDT
jgi:hypothetical protein